MILEEMLNYIHNYFEKRVYSGEMVISSNSLVGIDLQDGQYFKIEGSVFNDGIHQYPCHSLINEKFNGRVYALAIPLEVIRLSEEIETWQEQYGDKVNSPFQSESFGGYSYTKASGDGRSNNSESSVSWQSVFGKRLQRWRKIA